MRYWWLLLGFSCWWVTPALAGTDPTTVLLRADALRQGYTVAHHTGTVWVGVPRQSIYHTNRAWVNIARVAHPDRLPGSEQALTDVYRYSIRGGRPFTMKKPLRLRMAYQAADRTTKKILKYWDASRQRWRRLKTLDDDPGQLSIGGQLQRKRGIIAVFPKSAQGTVVQGTASWYDWTGAACNVYPIGSEIRVTNVATGASVDSVVVSTGPFISGRIVDLPREQFAQIADLSAGVVEVTVQGLP